MKWWGRIPWSSFFECQVVSQQHTSFPCPSPSPGVCSDSCPLSQWCHPTISSSVVALSSCLQWFPASSESGLQIRWPKYWSFSFTISPSNEYSGLISFRIYWSPCSPRDFQEPSPTPQFKSINALVFSLLYGSAFSLSSFTFIKRLFSSSSPSAIRVVSFTYLRLLIFLPVILIPACTSSSPAFHMTYSAYKWNKQGDNIQPWCTSFPIWNQSVVPRPVLTVASWPAYRFLRRQVRWSGSLISKNFPQFVVIHTNWCGFSIVNEADFFFFNSLAFSMIQWMLAIWSLASLPFLSPACTSGSSGVNNMVKHIKPFFPSKSIIMSQYLKFLENLVISLINNKGLINR